VLISGMVPLLLQLWHQPAEDCCCVFLQQRNFAFSSNSTTQSLAVALNAFAVAFKVKIRGAVSHQMPARSSLAAVFFREGRNHDPARAVSAESWGA